MLWIVSAFTIGFQIYPKSILLKRHEKRDIADGTKRSMESILEEFKEFQKASGHKINLEKSTLFMAGVTQQNIDELSAFPFESGNLHVREEG